MEPAGRSLTIVLKGDRGGRQEGAEDLEEDVEGELDPRMPAQKAQTQRHGGVEVSTWNNKQQQAQIKTKRWMSITEN